MPIRLSALTADRRTLKIEFGDDALSVTYRPSAFNVKQEARENEEKGRGEHIAAQARSLAEIIASWDLLGEDGKPVPPTAEVIGSLGLDVTSKITRAILDDLLPNPKKGAGSPNGSAAAGS